MKNERIRAPHQHPVLDALRNPYFLWLWVGELALSATMRMNGVAQGWLIYHLTGSALALGWIGSSWSITFSTLSLYGGVISDRIETRRLLCWTQGGMAVSALVTTILIATEAIQLWHLAVYALLRGLFFALMIPARQAMLAELVDRTTLLNAVSLTSVGRGIAEIIAASLAGFLIDVWGGASVYISITVLSLWVFFTLTRLPLTGHSNTETSSVWSDLRMGLAYLKQHPILLSLLGIAFARGFLAMPYRTFMPKYAQDVMGLDATGLGILSAAPGVGSLTSALVMTSLGDFHHKGKVLLSASALTGISLVLFASTQTFTLALVWLALVGAALNVCMVTNQTLMQIDCEDEYRGRVMSMYVMAFGLASLGMLPVGGIADHMGVIWILSLQGALFALFALSASILQPKLRQLE